MGVVCFGQLFQIFISPKIPSLSRDPVLVTSGDGVGSGAQGV